MMIFFPFVVCLLCMQWAQTKTKQNKQKPQGKPILSSQRTRQRMALQNTTRLIIPSQLQTNIMKGAVPLSLHTRHCGDGTLLTIAILHQAKEQRAASHPLPSQRGGGGLERREVEKGILELSTKSWAQPQVTLARNQQESTQ